MCTNSPAHMLDEYHISLDILYHLLQKGQQDGLHYTSDDLSGCESFEYTRVYSNKRPTRIIAQFTPGMVPFLEHTCTAHKHALAHQTNTAHSPSAPE